MKQDKGDAGRAETNAEDERFFAHLREQGDMLRHRTAEVEGIRRYCNQIVELFANRGVLLAGPFLPLAELGKRELSPEQKERHLSLTAEAARLYMLGERTRREIVKIADELGNREPGIEITFALFGETLKYGAITARAIALYYEAKALCEELGDTQAGKALAQGLAALLAGQADVTAKLDALRAQTTADHQAQADDHRKQSAKLEGVPPLVGEAQDADARDIAALDAYMTKLKLPKGQREVYRLYRLKMTQEQIAANMKCDVRTVRRYGEAINAAFAKAGRPGPIVWGNKKSRSETATKAGWAGGVTSPDDPEGDRDE